MAAAPGSLGEGILDGGAVEGVAHLDAVVLERLHIIVVGLLLLLFCAEILVLLYLPEPQAHVGIDAGALRQGEVAHLYADGRRNLPTAIGRECYAAGIGAGTVPRRSLEGNPEGCVLTGGSAGRSVVERQRVGPQAGEAERIAVVEHVDIFRLAHRHPDVCRQAADLDFEVAQLLLGIDHDDERFVLVLGGGELHRMAAATRHRGIFEHLVAPLGPPDGRFGIVFHQISVASLGLHIRITLVELRSHKLFLRAGGDC